MVITKLQQRLVRVILPPRAWGVEIGGGRGQEGEDEVEDEAAQPGDARGAKEKARGRRGGKNKGKNQ